MRLKQEFYRRFTSVNAIKNSGQCDQRQTHIDKRYWLKINNSVSN